MSLRRLFVSCCALLLAACGPMRGTIGGDGGPGGDGSAHGDGSMPGMCAGPPGGVSTDAAAALALENQVRTAMGVPCATMDVHANQSATLHCNYYVANQTNMSCVSNPHQEVSGCSMFVAMNFWDRMTSAGYTGQPASEDMAFMGDGAGAVQQWIDSIWHRTPILSPWTREIGYGNTSDCDTIDFGVGEATPDDVVATYPYAGQTGVPVDFDGRFEGPPPPPPPSGWPSGYPITVFIQGSLTEHTLTDAGGTEVPHMWIGHGAMDMGLLMQAYVMYANAPLAAHSTYHVHVAGGSTTLDWSFTTR